ncbi:MAG: LysM peptidoglycan-binding domain-containing protein [Desulfobulbaceae bacterium]|nr:LysM peptidoglycan-binding domain-containing protein [Desulfobulbaceae bacterium]
MFPFRVMVVAVLCFCTVGGSVSPVRAGQDPFPQYDCITPNVAFWCDIYGKYPSSQGVLHDKRNLRIIYEVLDIEGVWENAARERDRQKIERAKEKYLEILKSLASGALPHTKEEKRVAGLFGPKATVEDFLAAQDNIRFQSGQKDNFRDGLIRSGAYLEEIKEIMASYGVPEDLAYLPHVESSFNYKAYSKFGAAGIWQFTESSGKQFNLDIDYAIDERRDPLKATHAAARMLRHNYEKLGTWPLAVTAYNHGINGMMRAKAAKGDYERIFLEHESGLFKFASRNFYSEFLAAREVAKNYKTFFGPLPIEPPVNSKAVSLPNYALVKDLLKHLNVDLATFKALNPALREPVYLGQKLIPKGYQVRVPQQGKIVRLADNIPPQILKEDQAQTTIYQVRQGDTAFSIARQHGITVADLLRGNGLDEQAVICPGQNLRIPGADERGVQLVAAVRKKADVQHLIAITPVVPGEKTAPQPEPVPVVRLEGAPAAAPPVQPPKAASTPEVVTAQVKSKAAEPVVVTAKGAQCPPLNPAKVLGNLGVEQVTKKQGKAYGTIRVEAEETLGHYARWLGIRAWDLRRLNGLRYEQSLAVNQQVKIPLAKGSKEKFEAQRYEFHKEIIEDFFAAYRLREGTRSYKVKQGDTIWSLCQNEFELPFWLVKKYNASVDFAQLKPGVRLVVPHVESIR